MITVVGSANMDLIARVPRFPVPGETVLSTGVVQVAGGKGANQAVAAAKAGSRVSFVGRIGADSYGETLTASLAEAGVSLSHLVTDPSASTGLAVIWVDEKGENEIVVIPGANGNVTIQDIDNALSAVAARDVILVQLEIPLHAVVHTARLARQAGATVILNPAPARELPSDLMQVVDILVPNQDELARLSGMGPPMDPARVARMMLNLGPRAVIVTLGVEGALVITDSGEEHVPSHAVSAVDTTGAGDAFVGNLAHGLDSGWDLTDAVRFAVAAAGLSVQRAGAQPAMPWENETERFMKAGGQP